MLSSSYSTDSEYFRSRPVGPEILRDGLFQIILQLFSPFGVYSIMETSTQIGQSTNLAHLILTIRKQRAILDVDLAGLYGVETKQLNRAVKRNLERFPEDFMFQLTSEEAQYLRCQSGTSSHGGRRYLPYVFTQEGVAMLSSVLSSSRAIQVNIAIMRAFIRLREMTLSIEELSSKVNSLERGFREHGEQFEMVFNAIRQLMTPPEPARKRIGFHPDS